jgi:hypothetical protein
MAAMRIPDMEAILYALNVGKRVSKKYSSLVKAILL